jgi:hypothetical protein
MVSNLVDSTLSARSPALPDIDPIALGQAGLQALALAGTVIFARYSRAADSPDGVIDPQATLPRPHRDILMRALGAFAEPVPAGDVLSADDERRQRDALAAMCLRARTTLARDDRLVPRMRR